MRLWMIMESGHVVVRHLYTTEQKNVNISNQLNTNYMDFTKTNRELKLHVQRNKLIAILCSILDVKLSDDMEDEISYKFALVAQIVTFNDTYMLDTNPAENEEYRYISEFIKIKLKDMSERAGLDLAELLSKKREEQRKAEVEKILSNINYN